MGICADKWVIEMGYIPNPNGILFHSPELPRSGYSGNR